MSVTTLNQIVQQLEELDFKQLQELSKIIENYLLNQEDNIKKANFHQALISSGLVKKINQPNYSQKEDRKLIEIQGNPISETIIQERR
jgi:hypothetical protein